MKITKGCAEVKPQKSMYELLRADLRSDDLHFMYALTQVRLRDLMAIRESNPGATGRPHYIAFNDGVIHLEPTPDKDYSLKVIGTTVVEQ